METYTTAGGYTRREVERQRAELALDIETTARMIEKNPAWSGETLPGWYAERAARFAYYVIADLRLPLEYREHSARYHAAMAEDAARSARAALRMGYRLA